MVRLALYHPESGYTAWGPEVTPIPHGVMGEWDMREAIGEAIQGVSIFMDKPAMAIMAEHNTFTIIVKDDKQE